MNIPNLPTDNLYKFVALAGTIIVIVCFYLPFKLTSDISYEIINLEEQREILEEKLRYLVNSSEELQESVSDLEADVEHMDSNDTESVQEYNSKLLEMMTEQKKIISVTQKIKIERIKLSFNTKRIERRSFESIVTSAFFIFFEIIGFVMAIYGFKFWYKYVQRYQDLYLKNQANEINKTDE